jgi:hypothetical protein
VAVPLINDQTIVNAAGWWNPLSALANANEAGLTTETNNRSAGDTAINNRLNSTIALNGISDLPSWKVTVDAFMAAQNWKRKTAIQTVNNSVALVNDTHLVWALATNSVYVLNCWLFYDSSAVADIKLQFTVPAAASMLWAATGLDSALALRMTAGMTAASVQTFGGAGAAAIRPIMINGQVTTVGTAGNLTLQWAQNALEVSNTNMQPASNGLLQKVA